MAECGWVLDHLDDIASDLSVFHRVDDYTELDGPRFFRLAYRLAAYAGVMQARIRSEAADAEPRGPNEQPFEYSGGRGRDVNPGTKASLQADPVFNQLVSFG